MCGALARRINLLAKHVTTSIVWDDAPAMRPVAGVFGTGNSGSRNSSRYAANRLTPAR